MEKKLYNNFGSFLKNKFHKRVYKISVDCGFTCPNRDGYKSTGGCIYCDNESFKPLTTRQNVGLKDQIEKGINHLKKNYKAEKFIVFFQPYSNTYGESEKLITIYKNALKYDDIVGISISTRPDCIKDEILDFLDDISKQYYVWVEYGVQSIHDKTLEFINRGHKFKDFLDTYERTRKRKGINICTHIIHGLPNETKEMMLETIKVLSNLKIDGIKFHQLYVVSGTKLQKMYLRGEIKLFELDEYLEILAGSLELLPSDVLIHRLFGISQQENIIAPKWNVKKTDFIKLIDEYLIKHNSYQGKFCKNNKSYIS